MVSFSLATRGRLTRLLVALGISGFSFVWLFGPELLLRHTTAVVGLSDLDRTLYRLWKVVSFLIANGLFIYLLLGRLQPKWQDARRFDGLVQGLATGAALADEAGVITFANAHFLRLFGLSVAVIGQFDLEDLLHERVDGVHATDFPPPSGRMETRVRVQRGAGPERIVLVTVVASPPRDDGYLVFASEVGDLDRLRARQDLLHGALDALTQALIICDATKLGLPIVYANTAAEVITGYPAPELVGAPWSLLHGPDRDQSGLAQMRLDLVLRQSSVAQIRSTRKDGSVFLSEVQLSSVRGMNDKILRLVCLMRDVTEESRQREAVNHELYRDEITGLLNRTGFLRALAVLLAGPEPGTFLLAKMDVQDFHEFNTALGWDAGDALLVELSQRLSRAFPAAIIGRIGADQYGIFMPVEPDAGAEMATRLRQTVEGPFTTPGLSYEPLLAIGYTMVPTGTVTRVAMQQSSVALNEARSSGPAATRRFDRETETRISDRRRLTSEIQLAVQDRNFVVDYQPVVDLASRRILAAEAVLRWQHPLFGAQEPPGFRKLAEETGLILKMTAFMLTEAARFAGRLNRIGQLTTIVCVGLSRLDICQPNLLRSVEQVLAAAGILPSWLQFELSEHSYAVASRESPATLTGLRQIGVRLAIDRFSAGHSSLRHLDEVPVDEVTIDPGVTRGIEHAGVSRAIGRAVLLIGAAHGLSVRAKGVQTERERDALLDLGCMVGQGSLFSDALDEPNFLSLAQQSEKLQPAGNASAGIGAAAMPDDLALR